MSSTPLKTTGTLNASIWKPRKRRDEMSVWTLFRRRIDLRMAKSNWLSLIQQVLRFFVARIHRITSNLTWDVSAHVFMFLQVDLNMLMCSPPSSLYSKLGAGDFFCTLRGRTVMCNRWSCPFFRWVNMTWGLVSMRLTLQSCHPNCVLAQLAKPAKRGKQNMDWTCQIAKCGVQPKSVSLSGLYSLYISEKTNLQHESDT